MEQFYDATDAAELCTGWAWPRRSITRTRSSGSAAAARPTISREPARLRRLHRVEVQRLVAADLQRQGRLLPASPTCLLRDQARLRAGAAVVDVGDYIWLWAVNDTTDPVEGTATVRLVDPITCVIPRQQVTVRWAPGQSVAVLRLDQAGIGTFRREYVLFADCATPGHSLARTNAARRHRAQAHLPAQSWTCGWRTARSSSPPTVRPGGRAEGRR